MGKSVTAQYRIIDIDEVNRIYTENISDIESEFIVENNGAFATIFNNGNALLRPPVLGGNEGIYFDKSETMFEMIKSLTYPVKSGKSFWERKKNELLELPRTSKYFNAKLSEMLNYNVSLRYDSLYLKNLSIIVNNYIKNEKVSKDFEYYVVIYLVDILRIKLNGEWNLRPQPALNTYYIPELLTNEGAIYPWNYLLGQIGMSSFITINIEKILENSVTYIQKKT